MSKVVALLALLTIVTYRPLLTAGFVYEDGQAVTANPAVLTPHVVEPWKPRWLTQATAQATILIAGLSPRAFHAGNLFVHLLNGALLLLLARQLGWSSLASVAAVALFWLHPMQAEAVSYISARSDLLAATGVLVTLLCATAKPANWFTRIGIGVGVLLAWGGKETGIVAVLLLILLWIVNAEYRPARGWWLPLTAGVLAVGAIVARPVLENPYAWSMPHGGLGYLAIQVTALWRYLALIVYPVGFTVDHDFYRVTPALGLSLLALTALACIAAYHFKERALLPVFAALWIVVALLPRFFVRIPEFLNEHQMYVPMIGVCLLAGCVVDLLTRQTAPALDGLLMGAGDSLW